jgi:hypothetical protein
VKLSLRLIVINDPLCEIYYVYALELCRYSEASAMADRGRELATIESDPGVCCWPGTSEPMRIDDEAADIASSSIQVW